MAGSDHQMQGGRKVVVYGIFSCMCYLCAALCLNLLKPVAALYMHWILFSLFSCFSDFGNSTESQWEWLRSCNINLKSTPPSLWCCWDRLHYNSSSLLPMLSQWRRGSASDVGKEGKREQLLINSKVSVALHPQVLMHKPLGDQEGYLDSGVPKPRSISLLLNLILQNRSCPVHPCTIEHSMPLTYKANSCKSCYCSWISEPWGRLRMGWVGGCVLWKEHLGLTAGQRHQDLGLEKTLVLL